jgi:hypothetical protein
VTGTAVRPGSRAHIGLKFGRVLIYLEDRAALTALVDAVQQAVGMATGVFGPVSDAFTEAESDAQHQFERSGITTHLD